MKIKLPIIGLCLSLSVWQSSFAQQSALDTQSSIEQAAAIGQSEQPRKNLFDNPNARLVDTPWSIMFYRGWTSDETFLRTLRFKFDYVNEDLYSAELAYTLAPENSVSQFFDRYLRAKFQLAGNVVNRDDRDNNFWEFNAYFVVRWRDLPWNRYVPTTFAMGQGVSYATRIPRVEIDDADEDENPKRFLHYMMVEATFALPSYPQWQLLGRIHHRSGVRGLYSSGNVGSNTVGVGLRYHF